MKKALLIDDDEMDLGLLQAILAKEGYAVYSTADGPQGITLYKSHHPDVVFLDLGLPSMNGIEVLRELRIFDERARIVLITGYASVESASAAMQLGAVDYIEKTGDVESMIKKIRAALRELSNNNLA